MTPQEKYDRLEAVKPYCLVIGFINGEFDACVCLSEKDFKKEKRRFDVYRVWGLLEIKNVL